MQTYDEFFKQWNNKPCDFDGKYGNQCFDLFQYYNRDVVGGGFVFGAVASDIWDTYPTNLYNKVANTATNIPPKGAVIIWKKTLNGGFGHVGIASGSANVNNFEAFEQNDPTGSYPHLKTYSYANVFGWLVPNGDPILAKYSSQQLIAELIRRGVNLVTGK